jgi:hypothetical protein
MTLAAPPEAAPSLPPEADGEELARLGIARVRTEYFQVGPYRYATLADAMAQARRGRIAENDG